MNRNESLRDQIATIVQGCYSQRATSTETADQILDLIVPHFMAMIRRRTGAPFTDMRFRTVTEEDMLRSIRWARGQENGVSKQIKEGV